MRRSLSFLINRKLAMGFKSWLGYVAAAAGAQAQRNSMSRALLHLLHRELSRGWMGWREDVNRRALAIKRMRVALFFLMTLQAANCLSLWRDFVSGQRAMSRGLLHMINRELSRGWVGWHAHWMEAVRARERARGGLSRLMNRQLSAGWGSWVELVAERRASRELMRRRLTRRSTLLGHLQRWRIQAASGELSGLLGLQRALALQA